MGRGKMEMGSRWLAHVREGQVQVVAAVFFFFIARDERDGMSVSRNGVGAYVPTCSKSVYAAGSSCAVVAVVAVCRCSRRRRLLLTSIVQVEPVACRLSAVRASPFAASQMRNVSAALIRREV